MKGRSSILPARIAAMALLVTLGCREWLGLDVGYAACVPYGERAVEDFAGSLLDLTDRCWIVADGVQNDGGVAEEIDVVDGDLLILPNRDQYAPLGAGVPMVYLEVTGDFLLAARVETVEAGSAGHCVGDLDRSGLVARSASDGAKIGAVLLGPDRGDGVDCAGSDQVEPHAGAEVWSRGLEERSGLVRHGWTAPIGADAEADIAVCRARDRLYYYYYDPAVAIDAGALAWRRLEPLAGQRIGTGLLRVGLMATGAGVAHFDAIAFQQGDFRNDGCSAPLEEIALPEGE